MARVKCDYCGNFINDTLLSCPACGAPNSKLTRTANTTPQTIEQLQDWYKARNLPPESVTRFFIGKDISEPKAFGIYKQGSDFIVYKNKADGSRAVRYKGSDEAYAVNEIYLKLKEEILFQKNSSVKQEKYRKATYSQKYNELDSHRRFSTFDTVFNYFMHIWAAGIVLIAVVIFVIPIVSTTVNSYKYPQSNTYYYEDATDNLYFYEGKNGSIYEWWVFNPTTEKWNSAKTENKEFINNLSRENKLSEEEVIRRFPLRNIYKSKEYIDAGHHYKPSSGYYQFNNQIWYFLDDSNYNYGNGHDNSGWYSYDSELQDWTYYSDYDDKQQVPPELYYEPDSFYSFSNNPNSDWYVKDFENTNWYRDYQEHEQSYEEYWDNQNSSSSTWDWSSDSSWDWDSGSSWDSSSSSSGWDSDW